MIRALDTEAGVSSGVFDSPKSGYLQKKGMGSIFRTWKQRKFVLGTDFTLSYFDENDAERGILDLGGARVREIPPSSADGRENAFEIYNLNPENGKKSSLILAAVSAEETKAWVDAIRSCLQAHGNMQLDLGGRQSLNTSPVVYKFTEALADEKLKAARRLDETVGDGTCSKEIIEESQTLKLQAYAIRLQCRWRAHQARKYIVKLKDEDEIRKKKIARRRHLIAVGATLNLQCAVRRWLARLRANKLRKTRFLKLNKAANFIINLFRTFICKKRFRAFQENSLQSLGMTIRVLGVTCADPYVLVSTLSVDRKMIDYSRENFEASEVSTYDQESDPNGMKTIALQKCPVHVDDPTELTAGFGGVSFEGSFRENSGEDLTAKEEADAIISSASLNGSIVITLLEKDVMGVPDFYGQAVLNFSDHTSLYSDGHVEIEDIPLIEYVHQVQASSGKRIKPKLSEVTGSISITLDMPRLWNNFCGWLVKKSTGMFTKGVWKKKWIVLCGDRIWHYESPWHMDHVKGCILCKNVLSFEESEDGVNFTLKFTEVEGMYGDKKISKSAEKVWNMRWDSTGTEETKETWRRRLNLSCSNLFRNYIK